MDPYATLPDLPRRAFRLSARRMQLEQDLAAGVDEIPPAWRAELESELARTRRLERQAVATWEARLRELVDAGLPLDDTVRPE